GMGYCVLTAANRPTAVETAKGQKAIDFVLSDVILPDGMLGPDVARALIDLHPNAKVLLMSGYTRDAFDHEQISDQQFALIQKPFSPKALSRQIRQILDESVAG
ncbi:MAG: response regulator, partial [Alphaproteobacteria bacterium]